MNKITLSLVGALATIAVAAPSAHAATFGEWLAYCAGGDKDIDATIKKDAMAGCGVETGVKSACSVLSGTPWTCSLPAAKPKDKDEQCDQLEIKFEIGLGFAMPGTWKVKGNASATYSRFSIKKNVNICNTSPVIPTPMGMGGAYSAESGDLTTNVVMKIAGEITVTSPVGIEVKLNAAASCERGTTSQYYKKAEVDSCGMPTPTPSSTPPSTPPPASPTPSSTPPSTPPPASPTPSSTPPSTPPPASPTPTSTPPTTPPPASPTPVRPPMAQASAF